VIPHFALNSLQPVVGELAILAAHTDVMIVPHIKIAPIVLEILNVHGVDNV